MSFTFNGVEPASVTFNGVEVNEIIFNGVSVWTSEAPIEQVLIDFDYTDNGDGTYTITDWKRTYNGESSNLLRIPEDYRLIL